MKDALNGYIPVLNLNNSIVEIDEEYINNKEGRNEKMKFRLKILGYKAIKVKYPDGSNHKIICWRKYIQN